MRTTLTVDDDLADLLKRRAVEMGRPFKEVVNMVLRRGLDDGSSRPETLPKVITIPFESGLTPGYDPDRMNQLVDDLEVEEFRAKLNRQSRKKRGP